MQADASRAVPFPVRFVVAAVFQSEPYALDLELGFVSRPAGCIRLAGLPPFRPWRVQLPAQPSKRRLRSSARSTLTCSSRTPARVSRCRCQPSMKKSGMSTNRSGSWLHPGGSSSCTLQTSDCVWCPAMTLANTQSPADQAYDRFLALAETRAFFHSLDRQLTESDTRAKLIDPLFKAVLGWNEAEIRRESPAAKGFVDYVLGSDYSHVLIEAKRAQSRFQLTASGKPRRLKLSGPHLLGTQEDSQLYSPSARIRR